MTLTDATLVAKSLSGHFFGPHLPYLNSSDVDCLESIIWDLQDAFPEFVWSLTKGKVALIVQVEAAP